MKKYFWIFIVIFVMIFTAGCQFGSPTTPQETPFVLSESELATLSALSTQVNKTPEIVVQPPTDTPTVTEEGEASVTPTNTSAPGSITITGITQYSSNSALVTWDVVGDFPSGFKVVWTDVQGTPTFPENNSVAAGSPAARSALINMTPGTIYYVRVCRFMYDTCDIYSNLSIFAFTPATATPNLSLTSTAAAIKTATAAAIAKTATITGTVISSDSTLVITSVKGGDSGKAQMTWSDKSSSSKGYKIIYSTTSSSPTYGASSTSYYVISSASSRTAYVDGSSNTKYYYRICRATTSGCGSYSATYTFTFPVTKTATPDGSTITISTITDVATGSAQVNWTASGSFPSGFKILYSKTTALPTLSDNVTVVSDGTLRLGMISGNPTETYHVRVCKYSGSACTIYSPVKDFSFAPDSAVITITGLEDNATTAGKIDLTWTATGTFTNGFKLLYSTTQDHPTFENASSISISDGTLRAGSITAAADTHYYLRICKFSGTTCAALSDVVEFTTKHADIVLGYDPAFPGDQTKFEWTITADNTDGYRLLWEEGEMAPVWPTATGTMVIGTATDRTATVPLTAGHNYFIRLCFWDSVGSKCSHYSNTFEVDIP